MDPNTIAVITLTVANIVFFCIVKFNDLKHLARAMKRVVDKVDEIAERVSKIEGKLGI